MPEQPFGVAAKEIELMLAAFLTHRPDVLDGMRARHFRHELREKDAFRSEFRSSISSVTNTNS